MPRRNRRDVGTVRDPHRPRVEPGEQRFRYAHARQWAAINTNLSSEEAHDYAAWLTDALGWVIPADSSHRQAFLAWEDMREALKPLGVMH